MRRILAASAVALARVLTDDDRPVGFDYTEDPAFPDRIRPVDGIGFLPTFGFSVEF
jgi:hypothetical protein